jgi:hypothetical protein
MPVRHLALDLELLGDSEVDESISPMGCLVALEVSLEYPALLVDPEDLDSLEAPGLVN